MSARRGGRGRARSQTTTEGPVRAHGYRQLRHPFEPQRIFSDDAVANIHDTALRLLEELGIKILLPEARDIFRTAGARVDDDDMVFIGRDIVEEALKAAPRSFRLRAANQASPKALCR